VLASAAKTRVVNMLEAEAFSLLSFGVHWVLDWRPQRYILLPPKKWGQLEIEVELCQIMRENGAQLVSAIFWRLDPVLTGWSSTPWWPHPLL